MKIPGQYRPRRRCAAGRFTALALLGCLVATAAAVARSLPAAERAAHYARALARAKTTGKDIVVLQRGRDWNRLGERICNDVWLSYRLWSDMAAKMLPPIKPEDVRLSTAPVAVAPKLEPFPGDLLGQDGMQPTSSASQQDRPFSYAHVLGGGLGYFDTKDEAQPWAQVQLPGEGELSGVVLLLRYEYAPTDPILQRVAPLKVSVSRAGKKWSEVASSPRAEAVFRLDLQDKGIKARLVRIERLPHADKTQAPDCFHFRNFLVYGRRLY